MPRSRRKVPFPSPVARSYREPQKTVINRRPPYPFMKMLLAHSGSRPMTSMRGSEKAL